MRESYRIGSEKDWPGSSLYKDFRPLNDYFLLSSMVAVEGIPGSLVSQDVNRKQPSQFLCQRRWTYMNENILRMAKHRLSISEYNNDIKSP